MDSPKSTFGPRTAFVLGEMLNHPDVAYSGADLAYSTGVPPATVSTIISRLLALEWAEQQPGKGNAKPIKLTRHGKANARAVIADSIRTAMGISADGGPVMTVKQVEAAVASGLEPPAVLTAVHRIFRQRTR
jgi:DNA-binding MarR family transcriptional regulator